jgi:hypothetical protein
MKVFLLLSIAVLFSSCVQHGASRSYIMVEKLSKIPKNEKVELEGEEKKPLPSKYQFSI